MVSPPPELIPDVVAEILLRLPPDDPAGLVRASAVCKPWLRTLTDPAFLRRYRAFHGMPRVLGFLHYPVDHSPESFVTTTAFRPHGDAAAAHRTCAVVDCRHGRVLFYDYGSEDEEFVVWDPITGRERRVGHAHDMPDFYTNHAVLCAAGTGCDHSACSGGPFLLASAAVHCDADPIAFYEELIGVSCFAYGCFYSSETGETGARTALDLDLEHEHNLNQLCSLDLEDSPTALVGDALYFVGNFGKLLRYDVLGGCGLSVMELPPVSSFPGNSTIVMRASNGELGLATFFQLGFLVLFSTEMGPNGDARWEPINLIFLLKLLPFDIRMSSAWLSGFAEDASIIFLSTDDNGIFTVELKSLLTRKVCEMGNVKHVFPYVSFYTPAAFARGTLQSPVETQ